MQLPSTLGAVPNSCDLNGMSKPADKNEKARNDIRAVGLRATPARVATLQLLRNATSPMSHADVAERLDEAGVDKATAFRNLNDMTDAGLLRRTELAIISTALKKSATAKPAKNCIRISYALIAGTCHAWITSN